MGHHPNDLKPCYAIAERFLKDHPETMSLSPSQIQTHARALAGDIADAMESYIDFMREKAAEEAEHDNDPHERAAARARANDWAETDGRDWS